MPILACRRNAALGAAAALLAVSACNDAASPTTAMIEEVSAATRMVPSSEASEGCLLAVWQNQPTRDEAFDRAHDRVEGGAISCSTQSSPSQFRDAIAALQAAAASGNRARMLEQIGIPLLYIDADGATHRIETPAAANALFDQVFDQPTLDALRRLELDRMTVVPRQGGFFELGALWLVVPEPGARPKLVTVNHQALREAAAAKATAKRTG